MKYLIALILVLLAVQTWLVFEVRQHTKDVQLVGTILRGSGIIEVTKDGEIKVNQINR